jgi:hypothetical protein
MILVTIVKKRRYHELPIEYAFNEGKGAWTYIQTHEEDCGPYFYKLSD